MVAYDSEHSFSKDDIWYLNIYFGKCREKGQNRRVLINPDGSLTDRSKKVLAKTPMNRFGDIKELNGAVQFLCSEAASFVTGAMLPIDGGFSAFSGV